MKIASSDILLSSQHAAVEKHSVRESLRVWSGNQRPDFEGRNATQPRPVIDQVSISNAGLEAQKASAAEDAQDSSGIDPRMQLLISMVERITGQKIKIFTMKDLNAADASTPAAPPSQARAGFGVEYDRQETHYESEQTSFTAQGSIRTADGKEIEFNLQLSMNREFFQQSDVSVRLGDANQPKTKDPLVINFNGNAAQLTSTKFSFDLDSDGKSENISFVAPGSAFLALDKNQDGKINNGSELFGAASGNGFNELASYDQDGNLWIDENDAVFADLKVWSKDAQGADNLSSLKEAGVGALFLGNVATEFSVKDDANKLDGQVRSSGVYLNENGSAGTLQQVDLVV